MTRKIGDRMTLTGAAARWRPDRWRGLLLVGLVSLAAHVIYLVDARHDPTFDRPVLDAQTYDQEARAIAAGHPDAREPFWQPPLYPYWLGFVYAVTADSIRTARFLQALLGVLTCLLTAALARRLFGEGVGILAGLLAALYGPLIFYDTQLLPAGLGTLLVLTAFLLLLRAVERPVPANWFGCGLVTGLAALTVGNALALVVPAAIWLVVGPARLGLRGERREIVGRGRRWFALAVLLAGVAAGIAPAALRNFLVSREFVPISTNAGINLYIGNNPDAWRTMAVRPGYDWVELTRLPTRNGATTPSAANAWFVKEVVRYATADPAGFLRGLLVKAGLLLNAREIPRNTDIYVHASFSPWLHALTWRAGSFAFPFGIVGPLALLGLLTGCRRRAGGRRAPARPPAAATAAPGGPVASPAAGRCLAAAFLLLYGASIVLFFVASRYRVVLTPFLALFAAAGIAWLWERRRSAGALLPGLTVLAAAGVAANLPVRAPADHGNFAAEMHLFLGVRAETKGNSPEAEAEYREALRIDPACGDAWFCLGNLRRARGDLDRAIEAYTRAVRFGPGSAEAHNNLAGLLLDTGRLQESIRESRAAIRLRPQSPSAYQNLGIALLRSGDGAAAADSLRQCLRLDPSRVEARVQLAWVLAAHPDGAVRAGAEAVRLAEEARRSTPDPTPMMLAALAAAYAELGRFDEALGLAEAAIGKAGAVGQPDLAAKARDLVIACRERRPYRDGTLVARR